MSRLKSAVYFLNPAPRLSVSVSLNSALSDAVRIAIAARAQPIFRSNIDRLVTLVGRLPVDSGAFPSRECECGSCQHDGR
jgi:hypothetical protein